jgi:hypothetical protein
LVAEARDKTSNDLTKARKVIEPTPLVLDAAASTVLLQFPLLSLQRSLLPVKCTISVLFGVPV